MIKIILDKQLDKETYLEFCDYKIGGVDFGGLIKRDHPNINRINYDKYIESYYLENKEGLNRELDLLNNSVEETQKRFFDVVGGLFKCDVSKKDYIGALSIFDCNPRYLDKNIFQIYYKRGRLNKQKVVYHEILHFIFFDYCGRELKEFVCSLDKNSGAYWELSELFNIIVLNFPEVQEFLQDPEGVFYPDLKDIYPKINRIWEDSRGDMREFIESSLELLKQRNK